VYREFLQVLHRGLLASMSRVLNQRIGILYLRKSVNFANPFYMYPRIHALAQAKKMDLSGNVLPPTSMKLELQGRGLQGLLRLSGLILSMMCQNL
jgi:hypothetical protein